TRSNVPTLNNSIACRPSAASTAPNTPKLSSERRMIVRIVPESSANRTCITVAPRTRGRNKFENRGDLSRGQPISAGLAVGYSLPGVVDSQSGFGSSQKEHAIGRQAAAQTGQNADLGFSRKINQDIAQKNDIQRRQHWPAP